MLWTRDETLQYTQKSHAVDAHLRAVVRPDGMIEAFWAETLLDGGAYRSWGKEIATRSAVMWLATRGGRCEDTTFIEASGTSLLTATEYWPLRELKLGGQAYEVRDLTPPPGREGSRTRMSASG